MRFGTNFRKLPEPEILTLVRQKKGRLKGHFRAQVPVRKGKTAILTSRQQPTGLHRSFPSVGPNFLKLFTVYCQTLLQLFESHSVPRATCHHHQAPWQGRLSML